VTAIIERLFGWKIDAAPQSLRMLMRQPRPAPTSKLYVLRTDFQVNKEKAADIDSALEPIRKKYGLDFILLEPGIKLSRFEDI
jgi:hypothetical protein